MTHWYTQDRLGAERRGDLEREAAREALRTIARSTDPSQLGLLKRGLPRLALLVRDRVHRHTGPRPRPGSIVVARPNPKPRPAATGINR